jgi:hypothetical protein
LMTACRVRGSLAPKPLGGFNLAAIGGLEICGVTRLAMHEIKAESCAQPSSAIDVRRAPPPRLASSATAALARRAICDRRERRVIGNASRIEGHRGRMQAIGAAARHPETGDAHGFETGDGRWRQHVYLSRRGV